MDLLQYKPLIDALPVQQQAFSPNENIWGKLLQTADVGLSLDAFQHKQGFSRMLLHEMALSPQKLIAILMWGYPTGGRGKNIENVLKRLEDICNTISFYENSDLTKKELVQLITSLAQIPNLGMATWSKFLYFCHVTFNKKKMVILDSKIADVLNGQTVNGVVFKNLTASNSAEVYCDYLLGMGSLSEFLGSDIDKLELFLFMFGAMLQLRDGQ